MFASFAGFWWDCILWSLDFVAQLLWEPKTIVVLGLVWIAVVLHYWSRVGRTDADIGLFERTVLALAGLLWPLMLVASATAFIILIVAPWERYRMLSEIYAPTPSGTAFKSPSVSITCESERLPVRGAAGDSLYILRLHPKWGNELDQFLYASGPNSYWPSQYRSGIAYRCAFTMTGTAKLGGVSVPVTIIYENDMKLQPSRTAAPTLPIELEPMNPFVIHILDDTAWSPTVVFPRSVVGRLDGQVKTMTIPVVYGTRDGMPLRLTGFN